MIEEEAEGVFAVCIQHEMDHLDGVLFIDHLSRLKRTRAVAKVKKAAKVVALPRYEPLAPFLWGEAARCRAVPRSELARRSYLRDLAVWAPSPLSSGREERGYLETCLMVSTSVSSSAIGRCCRPALGDGRVFGIAADVVRRSIIGGWPVFDLGVVGRCSLLRTATAASWTLPGLAPDRPDLPDCGRRLCPSRLAVGLDVGDAGF